MIKAAGRYGNSYRGTIACSGIALSRIGRMPASKRKKNARQSQIAGFQRHSALSSMTDYRKSTASTAPWLAKNRLFVDHHTRI